MSPKARTSLRVAPIVLLVLATGFFREFTFVNINEQLRFLYYENDVSEMSSVFSFLTPLSYSQLYTLKWFLTPLFALLFLCESILVLKTLFGTPFWREATFLYLSLLITAASLFGFFWLLDRVPEGYTLARFFMGLAQSPFPLMLLIPAILIRKSHRSKT